MRRKPARPFDPVARACRAVAVGLLAIFWRRLGHDEIESRLAARPPVEQWLIVCAALAGLAAASLLFAQAGVAGVLAFFIIVVLLVN